MRITQQRSHCSLPVTRKRGGTAGRILSRHSPTGVSLIELLCVIAIIGILSSMLFPTIFRVYERIKGEAEELEAEGIAEMLLKETRAYCAAHPRYSFNTKWELADKCGLAPKPRAWIQATRTEFIPFNQGSPTNLIVLAVHIGRKHATQYQFTKEDLSVTPQGH